MIQTPIYVVDAFELGPFTGNPAGVCVLKKPADEAWMQSVAAQMKHAETAFLWPEDGDYRLRWFTPSTEVDLCGHATLASAFVLGQLTGQSEFRFDTRSGLLIATLSEGLIQLDFPAEPVREEPLPFLPAFLGMPLFMGRNRMDWFVELGTEDQIRQLDPQMPQIEALGMRGLIATAKSAGGQDFVSRFFAPACGVPEDPATGSAHCALFPYWAAKLGKTKMEAFQASDRGGRISGEVLGDRVLLRGSARMFLKGDLTMPPPG